MKIKVCSVSFLNARPFAYGLKNSSVNNEITFSEEIPSVCSAKLLNGEADIGLVPVVIIPQLKNPHLISDFCIGADGPVKTVMLFSEKPLDEIKRVLLDFRSNTSNQLLKILAERYWKISPEWMDGAGDYEKKIAGDTAGLVIGDRVFDLQDKFPYCYDLAGEWKKFTGLPFVFACWVATEKLPEDFLQRFGTALEKGVNSLDGVCKNLQNPAAAKKYLEKNISFPFNEEKKKAMNLFLDYSLAGSEIYTLKN